jgi:hypothetical protein
MDEGLANVWRLDAAECFECHRSVAGAALKEMCCSQYRSAIEQYRARCEKSA